jgi:hypothetical protein
MCLLLLKKILFCYLKICTRYPQGNQGVERIKCLSGRRYQEIKRVKKEKIKIKGTPLAL